MEGAPITFHFIYWGDEKKVEDKEEGKEEFNLCGRCGRSKPLNEFHEDKLAKSWYGRICKECEKKHATIKRRNSKEYHKHRKEMLLERNRRYNQEHKDERSEYNKKYRQTEAGLHITKICAQRRRARKVRAAGDGISTEQ